MERASSALSILIMNKNAVTFTATLIITYVFGLIKGIKR